MADTLEVVASDDPESAAADRLTSWLRGMPGDVRLAIPGGSAAAVIGAVRRSLGKDWRRVQLTWVDERCVPFGDAASNRGTAYRAGWLDRHDPPGTELTLYDDSETPTDAVARVRAEFAASFGGKLDFTLLGMGEDGHIASIFPGWIAPDGPVAFVDDSPKPPAERVTLTPAALATARHHLLFATGEAKRDALNRLLAGDQTHPAARLLPLTIVTDLRIKPCTS